MNFNTTTKERVVFGLVLGLIQLSASSCGKKNLMPENRPDPLKDSSTQIDKEYGSELEAKIEKAYITVSYDKDRSPVKRPRGIAFVREEENRFGIYVVAAVKPDGDIWTEPTFVWRKLAHQLRGSSDVSSQFSGEYSFVGRYGKCHDCSALSVYSCEPSDKLLGRGNFIQFHDHVRDSARCFESVSLRYLKRELAKSLLEDN